MIIAGLVAALGMAAADWAGAAPTTWRYVVPPPGDPFESPPLRSIGLASEKPEDLDRESDLPRQPPALCAAPLRQPELGARDHRARRDRPRRGRPLRRRQSQPPDRGGRIASTARTAPGACLSTWRSSRAKRLAMSAGRPSFASGPPGSRSATPRRGISKARSNSPAAGTPSGAWTATATGSSPTARTASGST